MLMPLLQGVRQGHWSQLKYRGDPLRRPIASYELAPLARLAVKASEAVNTQLRLGQPVADDEPPAAGMLQVVTLPYVLSSFGMLLCHLEANTRLRLRQPVADDEPPTAGMLQV